MSTTTYTTPTLDLECVLGRPVHDMRIEIPLSQLTGKRILVTGAAGSIGSALVTLLEPHARVYATDIDTLDVTDSHAVQAAFALTQPEIIFHLAGAKHAPAGEEDPWNTLQVNAVGTRNVLTAAAGAHVVTASTCKACNPETAYGASKLITERLALNAGCSVARFFNVVETQGNVFDIWQQIPLEDLIPWTDCNRYFLALHEAVGLFLWAAILPPDRYMVHPGQQRWMGNVAGDANPGRDLRKIPCRRGDRVSEPLRGSHEEMLPLAEHEALRRIVSPHDEHRPHQPHDKKEKECLLPPC